MSLVLIFKMAVVYQNAIYTDECGRVARIYCDPLGDRGGTHLSNAVKEIRRGIAGLLHQPTAPHWSRRLL